MIFALWTQVTYDSLLRRKYDFVDLKIGNLFAIVFDGVVKCKLGNPARLDLGDHLAKYFDVQSKKCKITLFPQIYTTMTVTEL